MVSRFFGHNTVISRLKDEDLRSERIRLEMEQERSFHKIEELGKTKDALFHEMLSYTDKARQEAVATKIGSLDTQARLEQNLTRSASRQLKLLYTVETVKRFQSRSFQSPLVKRLLGAKPEEMNKLMLGMISTGEAVDEQGKELLSAVGYAMPENDREVQDLVNLAREMQSKLPADPDAAAEETQREWNKRKGAETPQSA